MITGLFALAACGAAAWTSPLPVLDAFELDVEIDYDSGSLHGRATLELTHEAGRPTCVPLQIGRLMEFDRVEVDGSPPASFQQDVVVFSDWDLYQVTQAWVTVPPGSDPSVRVSVEYHGPLVPYTESGMSYVQDRVDPAFTILRSEARAFPVIAVPSGRVNRAATRRDFDFRLSLTVPEEQVVAAPVSASRVVRMDDRRRWEFEGTQPVPFLNITVAPYETMESPGLRVFFFPEDREGAFDVRERIGLTRALYSEWFGPPVRDAPLTLIEIPEGFGSQASATAGIIQTADVFRSAAARPQLYHEVAHLWHPLDTGRPAARWNEGLATFLQARAAAHFGETPMDESMGRVLARAQRRLETEPQLTQVPMAEYGVAGMTDHAYAVGALFFQALERRLGPDRFNEIMGDYFVAYREGSDTEQFVSFLASAEPEAEPIVRDWLLTTRWTEHVRASSRREGPGRLGA